MLRNTTYNSFSLSGPSLDRYYSEMERFFSRADADMWSQYAFQDSLFATGDYFPDLERRYDRDGLPEVYLQHRIDDALAQWRSSPFARELDFAGFCEYLLPYRIATDYTPQWGNHSKGHQWSAIIQGDSTYHFMIGEPLFLAREKPFTFRLSKAYRRMNAPQRRYPGRGSRPEDLPATLRNPRTIDVTRYYTDVTDLTFSGLREGGRTRWLTLNVFDDVRWVPVAGAKRHGDKVTFEDVALNCVYLPMYYEGGSSTPAHWPVLVGRDRKVHELRPDPARLETVHLQRKFMDTLARQRADSLLGGRFELADNAEFRNAYAIAVPDTVGMNYQTASVPADRKFRYARYIPAAGTSGNIAEIELYDRSGKLLPVGKVIGTYRAADRFHPMENVFDGDVLSYASCSPTQREAAWVGVDLGRAVELSALSYLPRNDDNFIREGEEYELCYWDGVGWASLGRQIGRRATQELVYDNVPAGALLLLHNHTKGKEERIFTYEDGRQVWW